MRPIKEGGRGRQPDSVFLCTHSQDPGSLGVGPRAATPALESRPCWRSKECPGWATGAAASALKGVGNGAQSLRAGLESLPAVLHPSQVCARHYGPTRSGVAEREGNNAVAAADQLRNMPRGAGGLWPVGRLGAQVCRGKEGDPTQRRECGAGLKTAQATRGGG